MFLIDELINLSESKFILDGTNIEAISDNIDTSKNIYISGGSGVGDGIYVCFGGGRERNQWGDYGRNTIDYVNVFTTGNTIVIFMNSMYLKSVPNYR